MLNAFIYTKNFNKFAMNDIIFKCCINNYYILALDRLYVHVKISCGIGFPQMFANQFCFQQVNGVKLDVYSKTLYVSIIPKSELKSKTIVILFIKLSIIHLFNASSRLILSLLIL